MPGHIIPSVFQDRHSVPRNQRSPFRFPSQPSRCSRDVGEVRLLGGVPRRSSRVSHDGASILKAAENRTASRRLCGTSWSPSIQGEETAPNSHPGNRCFIGAVPDPAAPPDSEGLQSKGRPRFTAELALFAEANRDTEIATSCIK